MKTHGAQSRQHPAWLRGFQVVVVGDVDALSHAPRR